MVLRVIDNNVSDVYDFSAEKMTFTPIYRKISAGGRQTVSGLSSSKVIPTI